MADFRLGRIKFKWQGAWMSGRDYVVDDVVRSGTSSYVCVLNHTSGTWADDLAAGVWELMIEGGGPNNTDGDITYFENSANQRLPIGAEGQALIVADGLPAWTGLATAQAIYYVKADGNDFNDGSNLNQAFKSVRHACDVVTGPATIYVKGGLYSEILPIKVAANVTIVGDGQRITGIQPLVGGATNAQITPQATPVTTTTFVAANGSLTGDAFKAGAVITGTALTGTVTVTDVENNTPSTGFTTITVSCDSQTVASAFADITTDYSQGTMWQLNDGTTLNKMYFTGMTGFVPSLAYPEDITAADVAGVFIAFDPDHPIVNKSPYIIECASFSVGGIGAVVDGDIHASGLKSMVFHGYTTINSDGVGYWVNGEGKSEIVSCFTYYCWFGYTTTNGGKIRALNGNNSYGTYGVVSRGFDANEAAITGALYGNMITYTLGSLTGNLAVGDTVTGGTSGATGTITNAQQGLNKFYYIATNGNAFDPGETVTTSTGATVIIATAGATGQKGFVIVADGFSEEPQPGGSISVTGDTGSYIIQNVTGTYVNATSVMSIILANEKGTASLDNTVVTVRYAFSQSRLTGHDFLSIGTGNKIQTNYPGTPTQAASQANEVVEQFPGRVFYVSTDQDGNFRVGDYFRVDQATGRATLNASAFDLSGLTSLQLGRIGGYVGQAISEFSSDYTLSGDSNDAVPTEAAVRGYFENIATDVVPAEDNTLTLGTPSKRWNHVYVGPGSITIGTLTITDNAGTLDVKAGANTAPANINAISNGTSNVSVAENGAVTITANSVLGMTIDSVGNVQFAGNVTVSGGSTNISTTELIIQDAMIYMSEDNPADLLDIGFVASVTKSATYQHIGLVRDASDSVWKLFSGVVAEPTTTIDFTSAVYDDLKIGALSATGNIDVASTKTYKINSTDVLSASTVLGSATGITVGGTDTTTVAVGSNTAAANTVTIGGAVTGNTLKLAGTAAGTVNVTTDVTSGLANVFTTVTGTVNIGSSASGTVSVKHLSVEGVTSTSATGAGAIVFGTAPTIAGGTHTGITSLGIRDTSAAYDLTLVATSSVALTGARTLTVDVTNAARTIKLAGGLDLGGSFTTTGAFATTLTTTGATSLTLPTSGTLANMGRSIAMAMVFG